MKNWVLGSGLLLFFMSAGELHAQSPDAEIVILSESTLEIRDERDPQRVSCKAFQVGDTVIYDHPGLIRIPVRKGYFNKAVPLNYQFRMIKGDPNITHKNFRENHYALQIIHSDSTLFRIHSAFVTKEGVSIMGRPRETKTDQPEVTTLEIRLLNKDRQLVAGAIFGFIFDDNEENTVTTVYHDETMRKQRSRYSPNLPIQKIMIGGNQ